MQKNKTFLMIDGSSLLFRAFYAIRHLTTRDGIFTNGVYGFLNMFFRARDMVQPDYILVAFDRGGKTFRTEDYEAYKGTRQETPSELSAQFGMTKDVLDAMGICHLDREGYEADDIVGTVAKLASENGVQSYLLTGDRDYFQLVDENTTVLFTKKGITELEEVDVAWIQKTYDLLPHDLIEVKGLQGDTSDNIPGVAGIGEKTALKLIRTYGTIENVYAHIEDLKGKMRQNLEEGETQAYLSRRLGTIYRDVPLGMALDDFLPKSVDDEKLKDRFARLEFHSFAARVNTKKAADLTTNAKGEWVEASSWKELAESLRAQEEVPFALFADGESYMHDPVAIAAFGMADGTGKLLRLTGKEEKFRIAFQALFSSPSVRFIAYDVKESIVLLSRLGIPFSAAYEDVMLMEYLADPNRSSYTVDQLASRFGMAPLPSKKEFFGSGKSKTTITTADPDAVLSYLSASLQTVKEAKSKLMQEMDRLSMRKLYEQIENPLAAVLARMEIAGIAVDEQTLDALDKEFSLALSQAEKRVFDAAGEEFNLQSPKQLGEVLFEKMGLPHGKKTKTGYSTSAEVLEKLRDVDPVIPAILEVRKLSKLKSTYIDGLRPHIAEDGRIHSTFRQNVAATGRISSTEPNLQNIPVRTEEGRKLRAVFVAADGCELVDADYSQIELRILASLSGDETMIEAFRHGMDIHRKTAAEVNHISPEDVTPLQRSYAKAVNFGIIYGISDYGLSRDLDIPRKEAAEYIASYKDTYPQIRRYMENIVEQAKKDGYVDTYYGRRREIPELKSRNFNVRGFGERIALNTPIQGTAADLIKLAMIRVDRGLREGNYRSRLVLQIHDELIIEAPEEEAEEIGKRVVEWMQEISDFSVPIVADMNRGKSWLEAK
ncbi:DNA polymerase I [Murdochiella vaginalis]|uniref:DNA polymerase I n=1 Tax=Murdochiella vaginalis TaxID=1852373 RepID=UPI0008FDB90D|nr:DNA polymerase I [Murdochiella vaginalis]